MSGHKQPAWNRVPPGRGCPTGEVAYGSKKQARKIAKDMHKGGRPRPFTCQVCGGIHLGHKPIEVRNGTIDKADWLEGKRP